MTVGAILFGLLTGSVIGLTGGGGAIVAVPALVYGLGMPMAKAVPTSLIVVASSSIVGVLPRLRSKMVDWTTAGTLGVTGMLTAIVGARVHDMFPEKGLMIAFGVLMLIAAIRMFMPMPYIDPDTGAFTGRRFAKGIAVGAVVGFLTGLLGVGGGFLIVPALTILMHVPMHIAVGTSLAVVALNSIAGAIGYFDRLPAIDWPMAITYTVCAMTAALVAGQLGRKLPNNIVRYGFATLVVLLAGFVFFETFVLQS
ncbi:sulfite exporter TauE/SafE family protein [Brevibacterium luteolum]|uniref:Probable membrane transporter protein n=1 Tax=Brevibacterium luteolum TaxID=199591 RepID=A0A6G8KYD4_9MICO|nr:sulfite exporter TauE/SafE family protein [Brevibacterium luteolum]QIN29510.1 sulfite exporter TauE/SafE family protein [Brevibacterium luteolum]